MLAPGFAAAALAGRATPLGGGGWCAADAPPLDTGRTPPGPARGGDSRAGVPTGEAPAERAEALGPRSPGRGGDLSRTAAGTTAAVVAPSFGTTPTLWLRPGAEVVAVFIAATEGRGQPASRGGAA